MNSIISNVEDIASFLALKFNVTAAAANDSTFEWTSKKKQKLEDRMDVYNLPDLILFQGHGSVAAGSSQSYTHTFQLFRDQIWAQLFFFFVLR